VTGKYVDIVFDKLPGPDGCRFIEVEDSDGRGISLGEWVERPDGLAALRIPDPRPVERVRDTSLDDEGPASL
jgi:hypothetical protein